MANLRLKLINDYLYAVGTINGQRIRKSSGFTEPEREAAECWLLKFELELRENRYASFDDKPFNNLIDLYVKDVKPSYKEYSQIKLMQKHLGTRKVKHVRTNLDEYLETRHAKSKDNTINRDLNRIRAVINYGRDRNLCGAFEISNIPCDDTRTVYLDKIDRDMYIQSFKSQEFKDFATILNFQMLRFGQAASLTKHDVRSGQIRTVTRKGARKVVRVKYFPMHPKVKAIIDRRLIEVNDEKLFPNMEYNRFYAEHKAVCARLGLDDYRIHDNRSTGATHLLHDANATSSELALALGHTGTRNVERYAQARRLESILGKMT